MTQNPNQKSENRTRTISLGGRTHGTKAVRTTLSFDPLGKHVQVSRNTKHQLHEVRIRLRHIVDSENDKYTPFFEFIETDHPTGVTLRQGPIDLFTLVHLLVNIRDEEIRLIANRDEGIDPRGNADIPISPV